MHSISVNEVYAVLNNLSDCCSFMWCQKNLMQSLHTFTAVCNRVIVIFAPNNFNNFDGFNVNNMVQNMGRA